MFKLNKQEKAQGALEYLLIIGGALVIAVIVIVLILSMGQSNNEQVTDSQNEFQVMIDNTIIPPIITAIDCDTGTDIITISMTESPTNGVRGYRIIVGNELPLPTTGEIEYSNGVISMTASSLDIDTVDVTYDISVIALKNDTQSKPTLIFNCKAHD